jgi:segregation and condensation protein B
MSQEPHDSAPVTVATPAVEPVEPVEPDEPDAEPGLDLDALPSGAKGALEAVLMVVEEPVTELALAEALALPPQRVADLVRELAVEYDDQGRGFELREVAGGWRVFSRGDYAPVVERFVVGGQQARLTQAALETLAVVAYRQPVSRARVSAVRGVNVDGVMRTLVARGLVQEQGVDQESGAILYSTTGYFLERLGLTSVDELPALAPYLPEIDVLDELGAGASL